jgi:hypothetical protein
MLGLTKSTIRKITSSIASDRYSFIEGQYVRVAGAVPRPILQNSIEVNEDDVPERAKIVEVSGASLVPRQSETPAPSRMYSGPDLCRRFAWDSDDFARAKAIGLPPGTHRVQSSAFNPHRDQQSHVRSEGEINTWIANVLAIAETLQRE